MLSHVTARPAGVALCESSFPRALQPSKKLERLLGGSTRYLPQGEKQLLGNFLVS